MKSFITASSILLVLAAGACGDTVELGGLTDGGAGTTNSTSSTTGSGSTSTGATSTGSTSSGSTGSTGAGGASGSTSSTTTMAGSTVGVGGSPGTGGWGGGTGGADGGTVCGGFRGSMCPAGSYCDYEPNAMCGAADQPGVCKPIPSGACLADCPGVCGCNGKFYCNACVAHMAGTDDSTDRSCIGRDAGSTCSAMLGIKCDANSWCDYQPGGFCGGSDASGVCQPRPQVCPADCPGVCGCDGKVYCNDCIAHSMGFDVSPDTSCLHDR